MAALGFFSSVALLLISSQLLLSGYVSSASSAVRVLLEEGYVVTTVFDGHKLGINPHSVLPAMRGSSKLIILDSVGSAFYSVSPPISGDIEVKKLSGDGFAGYMDGQLTSAQFNQPRNFAVDLKGNIYVADRRNHAIRKITASGVKTIAGGYSQETGRGDGPGRNASFSSDFELSFIPESCSLLIADHGNQLIRQVVLKEEDCGKNDGSPSVLGAASIWALGLCLSCFLGLVIGIIVRPYIFPHEGYNSLSFSGTWRHCLINLEKRAHFSGSINGIARLPLFQLLGRLIMLSASHLSLVFRICNMQKPTQCNESSSLLDSNNRDNTDIGRSPCSQLCDDQLKGLITFEGNPNLLDDSNEDQGEILSDPKDKLDHMIRANMLAFQGTSGTVVQLKGSSSSGSSSSGLVKRR